MLLLPAKTFTSRLNTVACIDALDLLRELPAQSIDCVCTDLPYEQTACEWDAIIPFEPMWAGVKRVLKRGGVFVTTASQPFTSALVMSNLKWFRYAWVWEKTRAMGYLNANRNPLEAHEDIVVFYEHLRTYNPQMMSGKPYRATRGAVGGVIRDKTVGGYVTENNGTRYPRTVLKFQNPIGTMHPTQKPLELMDYLIRTHSNEGDVILDFCAGSGTTLIAARNLNRRFIGGDKVPEYVEIARKRLAQPYTLPMFEALGANEAVNSRL